MPGPWFESISSGLAGGVLASAITVLFSNHLESKRKKRQEIAHSLTLIGALESFAIVCAEYVDNISEAEEELYRTNDVSRLNALRSPQFSVPQNVDFGHIDSAIACQVLALPFLVRRSNSLAHSVFDNGGDFLDAHAKSMREFGLRGLEAWELSGALRRKAGLPAAGYWNDWDFPETLRSAGNQKNTS